MTNRKTHSVYISLNNDCLFPRQFDLWNDSDWNNDMPPFFKRLNIIEDDRSFVILAASVLEYQVDRFLNVFIPNSKAIINDNTNLSTKVKLIKAFNLIPPHFIEMLDCLRNIRNDFAHDLNIDSFKETQKSNKLQTHIKDLEKLWEMFKNDMCYWSDGKPLRLMYKDVWRVTIEGLRVFELNVRLFRQETEKPEFIEHLQKLSTDLRKKREEKEEELILKMHVPSRK